MFPSLKWYIQVNFCFQLNIRVSKFILLLSYVSKLSITIWSLQAGERQLENQSEWISNFVKLQFFQKPKNISSGSEFENRTVSPNDLINVKNFQIFSKFFNFCQNQIDLI